MSDPTRYPAPNRTPTTDPADPIAVLVAIAEHHLGYTLPPERIAWDGPALPPEMTAVTLTPEAALNVRSDSDAGRASLAERLIRLGYQFGYAAGEWPERSRRACAVAKGAAEKAPTTDPDPPRPATPPNVAAFVLKAPALDRLLLVRSGKPGRAWELPGGAVEPGEFPWVAVVREVAEESGAEFSDLNRDTQSVEGCVVFHGTSKTNPLKPGGDAVEAAWVTKSDLEHVVFDKDTGLSSPLLPLSDLPTAALIRAWVERR